MGFALNAMKEMGSEFYYMNMIQSNENENYLFTSVTDILSGIFVKCYGSYQYRIRNFVPEVIVRDQLTG